jgi:hypothetical protein
MNENNSPRILCYLQKGNLSRKEEQVPDIGNGPIWRTAKNGMEF